MDSSNEEPNIKSFDTDSKDNTPVSSFEKNPEIKEVEKKLDKPGVNVYNKESAQKAVKKDVIDKKSKIEAAILDREKIRSRDTLNKPVLELYFLATCSMADKPCLVGDNSFATLTLAFEIYKKKGKDIILSMIDYSVEHWSFLKDSLNTKVFKIAENPCLHHICIRYEPILELMRKHPDGVYRYDNTVTVEEAKRLGMI
jgi:hypothetical protein